MATVVSTNLGTTLSPSPDATQSFYHRELLDRSKYMEHYGRFADSVSLDSKKGKTIITCRGAKPAFIT